MIKLSVNLLTFNGAKYMPYLFESLRQQTFSTEGGSASGGKNWKLVVMDNGSTDNTVKLLKKELENFNQPWQLLENKENIGFARGHNKIISNFQFPISNYILLLNQDVILAPDYLEKLVAFMEANPQVGAAQGMVLKWNFDKLEKTEIIDSLGLKVFRNRRMVDWGTGKNIKYVIARTPHRAGDEAIPLKNGIVTLPEVARDDNPLEIFGVSGTLPIYRRRALEEVKINKGERPPLNLPLSKGERSPLNLPLSKGEKEGVGEIFDEDFFSYKEDVDLAFRLRSAGWQSYLVPSARAWHDRTAAGSSTLDDKSAAKNRCKKSAVINYHSYKNHLFCLIKNEYFANFLIDSPWIIWYELKKFVYLLLFERATLKSLKEFWRLLPRMLKKRRVIKSKRKLFAREIRQWYLSNH